MGLPLPVVVPDVGPGGPLVTAMRGQNALTSDIYGNQIKSAQAQYAPYNNYADAYSKLVSANMLPYQIQSQVLSNPYIALAFQNHPEVLQGMINNLGNAMPQSGNLTGGINIPTPGGGGGGGRFGNGLLGHFMSTITGNQPSQNSMQGMPSPGGQQQSNNAMLQDPAVQQSNSVTPVGSSNGYPLVPSTTSPIAGAIGEKLAQFQVSPVKPGQITNDPNNPGGAISSASEGNIATNQQAIQGIANLKPILNDVSAGAQKWLAPGMAGKLAAAQKVSQVEQYVGNLGGVTDNLMKELGVNKQDISDYAEWQANQKKAIESYMKSRSWPNDELAQMNVEKIIQPIPGEGKSYGDRVTRELAQLENQVKPTYQQSLAGGFRIPSQDQLQQTGNAPQFPAANQPSMPASNQTNASAQQLMNSPSAQQNGIASVNANGQPADVLTNPQAAQDAALAKSNARATKPLSMVQVQTPDGQLWNIPADRLNAAMKRGAKKVG